MKAALNISILLNLGLLGGLILVLLNLRKDGVSSLPASSDAQPLMRAVATAAPLASARVEQEPFQWSQLESTNNYGVYVANLRAIGCPEPTICDIIKGEVDRDFSIKRQQARLDGTGSNSLSLQAEMQLVTSAMGLQAPIAETSVTTQNAEAGQQSATALASPAGQTTIAETSVSAQGAVQEHPWATAAPSYPLVFQNASLDALGLSDSQKAAVQQIKQQFVAAVSGPSQNVNDPAGQNPSPVIQNPSDPAYLPRWQTAQQNADDMLRATLGTQLYLSYLSQHYYTNFQAQILNSGGGPLTINPDLLAQ
jgi:hypothetical protein